MTAQSDHWRKVADIMRNLEFCADHDGFMTIDQAKARILVDEIYQLRLGRNVTVELSSGRTVDRVPPMPDRDGMQFEDRDGNVWTWMSWTHLSDEQRRGSGGQNRLVREVDDSEDEVLPWVDAWREHGPLWLLPDVAATSQLVLRTKLVVNGHTCQVQAVVDDFYWDHYAQDFHEHMKADLRRRLVDEIAAELNPPVSVQRQPKWIRRWETEIRNRYVASSKSATAPEPKTPAGEPE